MVEFMLTEKGLHALDLKKNPAFAYLLANHADNSTPPPSSMLADHFLHVNTIRENFEGYTKHDIKNATRARRLMGMVASPSPRDF